MKRRIAGLSGMAFITVHFAHARRRRRVGRGARNAHQNLIDPIKLRVQGNDRIGERLRVCGEVVASPLVADHTS